MMADKMKSAKIKERSKMAMEASPVSLVAVLDSHDDKQSLASVHSDEFRAESKQFSMQTFSSD